MWDFDGRPPARQKPKRFANHVIQINILQSFSSESLLNMRPNRVITSAYCPGDHPRLMSFTIAFSSAILGVSELRITLASSLCMRIALSGCRSSCAIDADSSPAVDRRFNRTTSANCCRDTCSAFRRRPRSYNGAKIRNALDGPVRRPRSESFARVFLPHAEISICAPRCPDGNRTSSMPHLCSSRQSKSG